jgi:hypothetical protein
MPLVRRLAAAIAILAVAASGLALAQTMPGHRGGLHDAAGAVPAMPGQDAFGAIQEIVRILEADPGTDWSKVDLAALRDHLVDMNKMTLEATANERPVDHGLAIAVTGSGRTLDAIRGMVPAQARELDRLRDWKATAEMLPDGALLTVTSADSSEVAHIRGLGFIGLLASGLHHQRHHLAIAMGEHLH